MRPLLCTVLAVLVAASPAAAQAVPTLEGDFLVGTDTNAGDLLGYCSAAADVPAAPPAGGLPSAGPLAVGSAPGLQDNPLYVFRSSDSGWAQAQRLVPAEGGLFGLACAVSADGVLLAVGAPGRESAPATPGNPGTAHIFRYDATTGTWGDERVLRAADLPASRLFGQSVALDRDGLGTDATEERLLAGGGHDAWMMRRANVEDSAWTEEARLRPEGNDTFSGLGVEWGAPHQRAAVVHGSDGIWRAMAGGPYTLGGTFRGSAYLWRLDTASGSWVREGRFVGASNGTCLGHSVALAEAAGVWLAAAGATQSCVGGGIGTGYVVIWRLEGEAWVEEARLLVPPEADLTKFGWAVALTAHGGRAVLVAAARARVSPASPPPGAFAFEREAEPGGEVTWRTVAKLSTATAASPNGGILSVGASGRWAVAGNDIDDTAGASAGAVYAYDLTGVLTAGEPGPVPAALALAAPAPHPVRGAARLSYSLPVASDVRLILYDALGRSVWRHAAPARPAGAHEVVLDAGTLAAGVRAAAGGRRRGGGETSGGGGVVECTDSCTLALRLVAGAGAAASHSGGKPKRARLKGRYMERARAVEAERDALASGDAGTVAEHAAYALTLVSQLPRAYAQADLEGRSWV